MLGRYVYDATPTTFSQKKTWKYKRSPLLPAVYMFVCILYSTESQQMPGGYTDDAAPTILIKYGEEKKKKKNGYINILVLLQYVTILHFVLYNKRMLRNYCTLMMPR